jgi:hypothetical protein
MSINRRNKMKQLLESALKALTIVQFSLSESKPPGLAKIIDDLKSTTDNWDDEPVCYRFKFLYKEKPVKSWIHEADPVYLKGLIDSGRPCVIEELYIHPESSKPLTDEDICGIIERSRNVEHDNMLPFAFAREVEKHIREAE